MDITFHWNKNCIALTLFGLVFPTLASAQSFEIIDLGVGVFPTAISENNTIVGAVGEIGDRYNHRPFVMCDGCSILGLDLFPYGVNGVALGISSDGRYVVGGINIDVRGPASIGPMMHFSRPLVGFLWQDGVMEALEQTSLISPAFDVNDHRQAVGGGDTYGFYGGIIHPTSVAALWPDGLSQDAARASRALGINNRRQIVGEGSADPNAVSASIAVLWEDGVRYDLDAYPGHSTSSARAINEEGQVVGWSGTERGLPHAILWDDGVVQDLGTLPGEAGSYALDINDHGQIVGDATGIDSSWSLMYSPQGTRPFLWQCDQMLDLNALIPIDSGWQLLEARSINNGGRIVGAGIKDGEMRGYMLRPARGPGRGRDQGQGNGPPLCPGSRGQAR